MQLVVATLIKHDLPDSTAADGPGRHHPRRRLRRPGEEDPMTRHRPSTGSGGRRTAGRRRRRPRASAPTGIVAALVQRHGALAVLVVVRRWSRRPSSRTSRTLRQRRQHRGPVVVPGDRRARHDLRDHHRRHRPVGRLGLRARRGARPPRRRSAGCSPALLAPLAVCGAIGLLNGLLIATPGWRRSSSRWPACSAPAACCCAITDEGSQHLPGARERRVPRARHRAPLLGHRLPGLDRRGRLFAARHGGAAAHPVRAVASTRSAAARTRPA